MGVSGLGERVGGHPLASGKNNSSAADLLGMVRQQKLQRLRLCKDPIYVQYLSTEKQRATCMRRRGWVEQAARPQMDEDLESEARQRVTALLSAASKNRCGVQSGVWAAFGKPYKTLGRLEQLASSRRFPMRENVAAFENVKKQIRPRQKKGSRYVSLRNETARTGNSHTAQPKDSVVNPQKHNACPQDSKFAEVPIKSAAARTRAARIVTPWLNPKLAHAERQDVGQYGLLSRHDQASVAGHIKRQVQQRLEQYPDYVPVVTAAYSSPEALPLHVDVGMGSAPTLCTDVLDTTVFTTSADDDRKVDFLVPHQQDQIFHLPSIATGCSLAVSDTGLVEEEPDWHALNQVEDSGDSGEKAASARVWQLNFKNVKARGRTQMQRLLWQRLQGRCEARAQPALAAGFYNAIISELEYSLGHRPACAVAGMPPRDPYDQAKMFMDHVQDATPVRKAPGQLQLDDVHILERFYNQICLLVEAQCPSDPMSLLCVQHVKELLESGHTLHMPLLNTLLDRFAAFVHSVNMTKPNAYLLPIFTFVQKCCGISDAALEQMLEQYKLCPIVFGLATVDGSPKPVTPLNRKKQPFCHVGPHIPASNTFN